MKFYIKSFEKTDFASNDKTVGEQDVNIVVQHLCPEFLISMFTLLLMVSTNHAIAQTLDEVVDQQLRIGPNLVACEALLGTDLASDVLQGKLASPALCEFPAGQDVQVSSTVSGGGAATTTYLPMIIQKRLKKDEDEEKAAGGGASADSIEVISKLGSGWNIFVSGEYQSLDRNLTTFEDGYRSDIGAFTGGIDKEISEKILAGLAFNYSHQSGRFLGTGDFNNNSYGGIVYASFTPLNKLFIQVNAGYASRDYDRNRFATFNEVEQGSSTQFRNVFGFAGSNYDGDDYSASLLSGYDFNFNSFTFGPRVGFNWVRNEYDSFSEQGTTGLELHFDRDQRTSLQSSFGLYLSRAFSTSFGVILPQTTVNWIHEFANNQRNITFSFVGDTRGKSLSFQNERPDRDFLEISAGTLVSLPHGIQAYVNYKGIAGHSYFDGHGVNAGFRLSF